MQLQAILAAITGLLHSDWHILCGQLSIFFQALLESHSGQHLQWGVWTAQIVGGEMHSPV